MSNKHYTIVIPAAIKDQINSWIEKTWPEDGKDNFSVASNTDGNEKKEPAYYQAGWRLDDEKKALLDEQIKKLTADYVLADSETTTLKEELDAKGVRALKIDKPVVVIKA